MPSEPVAWKEIQAVLGEALAVEPDQREAWLEERCGDHADLAAEVRSLLEAADGADEFFAGLARKAGSLFLTDASTAPDPVVGRLFGTYRLERQIGVGGMGAVYYAERADDLFAKGAAVKLLPPGLGTEGMRRRFAAERRILASLQHPGIGTLLDGGVADDGTPYFVMEYVDGLPIDRYCEDRRLSIDDRLELFLQACDAVDYAHRNLVVHRDLKPSNILVTVEGRVKLLDFGIAMLLDPEETSDRHGLTEAYGAALTPAFASPEQVRGEVLTTAADVYSLGVLLYLLLTGRRPYEMEGLSPASIERLICDTVPPMPSEMIRRDRGSDLGGARLQRRLRGDLDTIVMTALQKEPGRRYPSVRALVDDIQRHRTDRPVLARRDTFRYRASRFVARNRALVAAAAVATGLLLGFTGLAAYTAVTLRANNAAIAAERDRARLESEKAAAVSQFLVGLFGASAPDVAAGRPLTALELLEQGERDATALAAQPAVHSQVLDVIGQVYTVMGRYDRAEPLFRTALAIHERDTGDVLEMAWSIERLGDLLRRAGRHQEADSLLVRAVALAGGVGDRALQGNALNDLGLLRFDQGDYAGAADLHRQALEIRRGLVGERHERTAMSMQNLGLALARLNPDAEAEDLFREALDIYRETLGAEHTEVATTLTNLGRLLAERGDHEAADSLLSGALRINRLRLGEQHPNVALALNDLGAVRARQNRFTDAEIAFREALRIREGALGPDHPYVAISQSNLAYALTQQDRLDEAMALRRRALEIARLRLGVEHDHTGVFAFNLADLLVRMDRLAEAERFYRESIAILGRAFPDGHPLTTRPLVALGELLLRLGRAAEAETHLQAALAIHHATGADAAAVETVEMLLVSARR
jgi:eukaryotic-like serine/threonine-protein kinase